MNALADIPQDIAEGTLIGDHLRVVRKLGEGGMGNVYLVENQDLPDNRHAIKVLRQELSAIPRYAQMLKSEAQKQARLAHPNIVGLNDFFRWRDRWCLMLEFVDGVSLADLIAEHPQGLPVARSLEIMLAILDGVNHAHERGVLHCDIKPANVLIDRDNRIRVTDFGIAREVGAATEGDGAVVGTPEYMSPEQIEEPRRVDHRCDVYSAGVLFFEMLTGRLPFPFEGDTGVRFPQLTLDPPNARELRPELPPFLALVAGTAMQRRPAERFQGCKEFAGALVRHRQRERWRRVGLPAIAAASALLVAGSIGSYLWKAKVEERALVEQARLEAVARADAKRAEANARLTIDASVSTAIQQLASLCKESVRLGVKQDAVATALAEAMPDIADKLRVQTADMQRNLVDFAHGYDRALRQAEGLPRALVVQTLAARPRSDAATARWLQAVADDLAANPAAHRVRDVAELQARCPP